MQADIIAAQTTQRIMEASFRTFLGESSDAEGWPSATAEGANVKKSLISWG
jgi:hypothetical protein